MEVTRRNLRDGQPPAYVFTSPCCAVRTVLPAWVVEYARACTGGQLLIRCSGPGSDPLRSPGAVPAHGCGSPYLVRLAQD
jgi:hypothetical protein